MKVSIIIPTRNEQGAIGRVLKETPKNLIDEIIIIDGHSTDKTASEAKSYLRKGKDKFIVQKGKGYGAGLIEGFKLARGDIIIIMDGDGSHDPKDVPTLIEKIKQGYDYVIASRYAKGGKSLDDTLIRFIGNKTLTGLTNIFHGTKITDSLHFYNAITRNGLKKIHAKSSDFEYCIEFLILAHKAGLKFAEVPVVERKRFAGKSKVNAFWAGLKILGMILRKY